MIQYDVEDGVTQTEGPELLAMAPEELGALMAGLGQPAFRAKQLFGWLHQKRAAAFDEMTDLPAGLRAKLAEDYTIGRPKVARRQASADGTVKLLLQLGDGNCVETVLMHYNHGASVCVSSQVGCRMGCKFCASAKGGFVRNLTPGEMLAQVYAACDEVGPGGPSPAMQGEPDAPRAAPRGTLVPSLSETQASPPRSGGISASGKGAVGPAQRVGGKVGHLVLMGIGEPLDNFDNVAKFLALIQHPQGYDMAGRNISLSTCGVVPGIDRLAELGHSLTLSLSLHAATNEARGRLMPVNAKWPLEQALAACKRYQQKTGRRVSYEYALVRGENDSEADARLLAKLLAGSGGHLNLIPVNAVDGSPYTSGDAAHIKAFAGRMEALGVRTTVRRRLGADIDAACGQLRIRALEEEEEEEAE